MIFGHDEYRAKKALAAYQRRLDAYVRAPFAAATDDLRDRFRRACESADRAQDVFQRVQRGIAIVKSLWERWDHLATCPYCSPLLRIKHATLADRISTTAHVAPSTRTMQ